MGIFMSLIFSKIFRKVVMKKYLATLIASLSIGLSQHAFSHAGFNQLIPMQFHPHDDVATVYLTQSETLGEPETWVGNVPPTFSIITPKGQTLAAGDKNPVHYLKQIAALEVETKLQGTYKINHSIASRYFPWAIYQGKALDVKSGEKPKLPKDWMGENKVWFATQTPEQQKQIEQNWQKVLNKYNQDIKLKPEQRGFLFDYEAKNLKQYNSRFLHNYTTYISKDMPDFTALKTTGKGFEFDYKTHPNQLTTKSDLQFVTLLNGKVLPNVKIRVQSNEKIFDVIGDKNGLVNIQFPSKGLYMIGTTENGYFNQIAEPRTPENIKPEAHLNELEYRHTHYSNNIFVEVKD